TEVAAQSGITSAGSGALSASPAGPSRNGGGLATVSTHPVRLALLRKESLSVTLTSDWWGIGGDAREVDPPAVERAVRPRSQAAGVVRAGCSALLRRVGSDQIRHAPSRHPGALAGLVARPF